jgi:hypothetical protein
VSGGAGYFKASDVLDAARGRWVSVLGKLGVNVGLLKPGHGPCPGCGGRDRFRFDDQNGDGSWLCSQGGKGVASGNGLALLEHCTGWSWKDCVERVGAMLLPESHRVRFSGGAGKVGGGGEVRPGVVGEDVAAVPVGEGLENVPAYDEAKLRDYVVGVPEVTGEVLRRWSPLRVDPAVCSVEDVLDVLYPEGERVLIFTRFTSQGDFLYEPGRGGFRLASERGVKAVRSALPAEAAEGVWMLSNPVTGAWEPMANGKWGRRWWGCVTTFRYAVLESDDAPVDLWLRALVKLPLPIVAIYSSGGRSVHALVRVEAGSKPMWDAIVRGKHGGGGEAARRGVGLMDLVCPLGADPAALSAVRLTRLPFARRLGSTGEKGYQRYAQPRVQELFYLAPVRWRDKPEYRSILARSGLRGLTV